MLRKLLATMTLWTLCLPGQAYYECRECREWCGYGLQGQACMSTCQCDDPALKQQRPTKYYGAITLSGYTAWNGSSLTEAQNYALAGCRREKSSPELCTVVASFESPHCGALAMGSKRYSVVTTAPSKQQAQKQALAACERLPGNAGCEVRAAACAHYVSPEEKARNQAAQQAIAGAMGEALRQLWGLPPASPPSPTLPASPGPTAQLRAQADQGDARAQHLLGLAYQQGRGLVRDFAQAAAWYRKAAAQSHAGAQVNLGVMYQLGQGVPEDAVQAAQWYRKAADQGDADAQANLGMLYHQGLGVRQDTALAAHWYRKAAAQGHADAKKKLGMLAQRP